MRYYLLLLILIFYSCDNERIIQLPEIENAEITEVLDISPAYIFYDETQSDSTLLNRKNLISTTNWLVNVDKRLTLRQAIPYIKLLQDKKRNAKMHKNENAKNYFTCNDTSIGNLGFVEFTNVNYLESKDKYLNTENLCFMTIDNLSDIRLSTTLDINFQFSRENFKHILNEFLYKEYGKSLEIVLLFKDSITFQDYITVKNVLKHFDSIISKNEFIY